MKLLPIVERELRVSSRKAVTYWLRSIAALVLLLIFFWAVLTMTMPAARIADVISWLMGSLVLFGCAVAGIFQTADCLSSEKREGTAGLLFLTDLRGYDVVLGKLAANSLHCYYALLSVLPILALPLVMGGVTGGEFWRMVLVLLATLFFSLSIGMLVSAVSREARQAMIVTGAVIIFFNAILPGIYAGLSRMGFTYKPLLWPVAGHAFLISHDAFYGYGMGAREFFDSLEVISGIGLGCLLLASVILPRAWQEKAHSAEGGKPAGIWQRVRFGSARGRTRKRLALLGGNPFYWLTVRDRLASLAAMGLITIAAPILLLFFLNSLGSSLMVKWMAVRYIVLTTMGLGVVLKCLMAMEASRRLNDDRQSGALELLLVTPLTVDEILGGQRRALRRQFTTPMLFLASLFIGLIYMVSDTAVIDNLSQAIFTGNILVLVTDFYALSWVGMWTGLRAKNHHRAVLSALARILVLPWLGFLLLALSGELDGTEDHILTVFSLWFLAGMVNDVFWARQARSKLRKQFRPCAASVLPKRSWTEPIAELEPATA